MSDYYKPRRTRNIFTPGSNKPFKLSRSKLDLFLNCPRCFYLDRRLGVGQPPGYPFSLNSAVDTLLKKEFDIHRANGASHPLMKAYGIEAIPYQHEQLEVWRDSLHGGIQFLHNPTNFLITGGVDDVWVARDGKLIVVDYKATAKNAEVTLDADWQSGYKRQMEVYQWLFRQNGFEVSDTGYFVYANGKMDKEAFDARLEFDIKLLPYEGNTDWVEKCVEAAHACLNSDILPEYGPNCDFCLFRQAAEGVENKILINLASSPEDSDKDKAIQKP